MSEFPDPVVGDPDQVVVAVTSAGLCGSDLHPYLGREPAAGGIVPGHEAVGVVESVGPDVTRFRVGDRVIVPFSTSCGSCSACESGLSARCEKARLFGWGDPANPARHLHGCQAEKVLVPEADSTLITCPDVPDPVAVLLSDNLPTAYAAVRRAAPTDSLAVLGLGSVGLCAIAVARATGIAEVAAWDPIEERRLVALRLGASIVDPEDGWDGSAAVEAAGTAGALRAALLMIRPGATISIISVQTDSAFAITPAEAYDSNLTITAGRAPVRSVLETELEMLADVGVEIAGEIVDRPGLPLASIGETYRSFSDRGLIKATFDVTK